MYREDLLKEISSALSTHSDLDYDVATIVAQKYIDIRQIQSQEDALEYYSHRKEDISESEKIKRGIYFSKDIGLHSYSSNNSTLPTTFILMGRPLPYCSLCDFGENFKNPLSSSAEFSKTLDYRFVFKYLASPGVRGNMPNGIPIQTSVLSQWGITPVFMGSEDYGKPDTIREKISHLTKIPKIDLIKYLNHLQ